MHLSRPLLAVLVLAGCSSTGRAPAASTSVAATAAPSHCRSVVARARAEPGLRVDRVPEPLAYDPPPIKRPVPPGVVGKNGRAEVQVRVLVDTLGRANMSTFTVVKTTHPWLAQSVRQAVAKWRFTPAELEGCKVPRLYHFGAKAGGSRRAG